MAEREKVRWIRVSRVTGIHHCLALPPWAHSSAIHNTRVLGAGDSYSSADMVTRDITGQRFPVPTSCV